MTHRDDDLVNLKAHGLPPLPAQAGSCTVEYDGARIWYASFGSGPPVILLHGGMGNANNWAHLVPALTAADYAAIVIDTRGHGRSTRDARPYSYRQLAADTRAVMDHLGIARGAFVGWSDGADTALILADETPERVAGVFFFACNMDNSGTLPFEFSPRIGRVLEHHKREYAALSPTPEAFDRMMEDVGEMQRTQPNYTAADLARIRVPVWSVLGEYDEFIRREHAEYLARTIPGAEFHLLPGVGHFAPWQRPAEFDAAVLRFLAAVLS